MSHTAGGRLTTLPATLRQVGSKDVMTFLLQEPWQEQERVARPSKGQVVWPCCEPPYQPGGSIGPRTGVARRPCRSDEKGSSSVRRRHGARATSTNWAHFAPLRPPAASPRCARRAVGTFIGHSQRSRLHLSGAREVKNIDSLTRGACSASKQLPNWGSNM